jgi:hypothetical protein
MEFVDTTVLRRCIFALSGETAALEDIDVRSSNSSAGQLAPVFELGALVAAVTTFLRSNVNTVDSSLKGGDADDAAMQSFASGLRRELDDYHAALAALDATLTRELLVTTSKSPSSIFCSSRNCSSNFIFFMLEYLGSMFLYIFEHKKGTPESPFLNYPIF